MDGLVWHESLDIAAGEGLGDEGGQRRRRPGRIGASEEQALHIGPGRVDQAGTVAATGNAAFGAVVGKDVGRLQRGEAVEAGEMGFEPVGFGDPGDRVLQGIAGEEDAFLRQPQRAAVDAVDVEVADLGCTGADTQRFAICDCAGRQQEGGDRRVARFEGSALGARIARVRGCARIGASGKAALPAT